MRIQATRGYEANGWYVLHVNAGVFSIVTDAEVQSIGFFVRNHCVFGAMDHIDGMGMNPAIGVVVFSEACQPCAHFGAIHIDLTISSEHIRCHNLIKRSQVFCDWVGDFREVMANGIKERDFPAIVFVFFLEIPFGNKVFGFVSAQLFLGEGFEIRHHDSQLDSNVFGMLVCVFPEFLGEDSSFRGERRF